MKVGDRFSKLLEGMSGDELIHLCSKVYEIAVDKKEEESEKSRVLSDEKKEEVIDALADLISENSEADIGDYEIFGHLNFPLSSFSDEYIINHYANYVSDDNELCQEVLGILEMDKMLKKESV